jgi:uncharacterized protein with beta-barrel porin domain
MKSKLLLSASIVSLTIGLSGGAYASPSAAYYIDSDVSGDFTVPYDIGTSLGSETTAGLVIDDDAAVSGNIVNDHQIKAYNTGVNVNDSGTLEGAFINEDGGSITAKNISGEDAGGIYEGGYGVTEQDVQNSGHILASALGVWHGTGTGPGTDDLYSRGVEALGIYQINGDASTLSNDVSNDGHIVAKAVAEVHGVDVEANASAAGVVQANVYGSTLLNTVSNGANGHITASAIAKATGYGTGARAIAAASATGVAQLAGHAYEASNVLTNDGVINAYANATAQENQNAAIEASAGAVAIGVRQEAYATGTIDHYSGYERDSVVNHGTIHASAFGSATGDLANVGAGTPLAQTIVSFGMGPDQYKTYEVPNDAAIGIFQVATDAFYQANETVDNFGMIEARGIAVGSGADVDLNVAAVGVLQMATDVGVGTALVHNEASGEIYASASAGGHYNQSHEWVRDAGAATTGHAEASAAGVFQFVGPANDTHATLASDAYATVVNDGYIGAFARADMTVYENGYTSESNVYPNRAIASAFATGIGQVAGGGEFAQAKVTNNGTVYAEASAGAYSPANEDGQYIDRTALAVARGVSQFVLSGSDASASVVNDGSIEAVAFAGAGYTDNGDYGEGFNLAQASAEGVAQEAAIPDDGATAKLSVVNGTSAEIVAGAYAHAEYAYTGVEASIDGGARASALAIGVDQQFAGEGENGTAAVTNEGFIGAYAQGEISGYEDYQPGTANAVAFGIRQGNTSEAATEDLYLSLNNSGQIYAAAEAYASDALAAAVGVMAGDTEVLGGPHIPFYTDVSLHLDQLNTGRITAQAVAGGADNSTATALAVGIADRAGGLTGSIENDGLIAASAFATGGVSEVSVRAIGIDAAANSDNLTITNKGTIVAYVNATRDVSDAAATGILLENYTDGDSGSAKIVNDGGTIFAGIGDGAEAYPGEYAVDQNNFDTYNGGGFYDYFLRDDVVRGNAIRVSGLASGQDVEIDLKGTNNTGNIYGDILLGTNDDSPTIDVSNGLTRFNGIIEPTPEGADGSYGGSGTLRIEDGGTFKLVLNQDPETPYEYRFTGLTNAEQARVYVSTLEVQAGGILSIGLSPDNTPGDYGQVFAENIDATDGKIAGALKAHFIPGYYSANFHATYDSVVNSPDIDGGDVEFAKVYSNTPLIHVTATYSDDHVNIVADRVSFEDAAGTGNQKSVGHAIDQFYTGLSAPDFETADYGVGHTPEEYTLGDIIGSIFALDGTQAYENMMDDLSAEPYAQQLNQALTSFDGLQNLLLDRIGNGGSGGGGALGYGEEKMAANSPASNAIATTASIPAQPKAEFWARGFGDWQSQSDSSSAALAYTGSQAGGYFGGDTYVAPNLIVGAAGGLTSSSMSFDNGDHISSTGFQIAGYGRWDDNAWYVRGFGGYGQMSNDSKRYVPVMGTPVEMDGSYNTKVAGGYAELGYKGLSGRMGGITPFAGVSATWASNDAFTESGGAANLNVDASNATRVATSLGAQLSWDTVVGSAPFELLLRAAWQHAWTGGASSVNAAFNAEPTDGFTSTSTSAADLAALTASGTWKVAPLSSLTVQYDGKFGSGLVDTSVSGSFKQQF